MGHLWSPELFSHIWKTLDIIYIILLVNSTLKIRILFCTFWELLQMFCFFLPGKNEVRKLFAWLRSFIPLQFFAHFKALCIIHCRSSAKKYQPLIFCLGTFLSYSGINHLMTGPHSPNPRENIRTHHFFLKTLKFSPRREKNKF